jgi:hypothetical protein
MNKIFPENAAWTSFCGIDSATADVRRLIFISIKRIEPSYVGCYEEGKGRAIPLKAV